MLGEKGGEGLSAVTEIAVVNCRVRGVRGVELGEAEIAGGGVETPVTAIRSAALGGRLLS